MARGRCEDCGDYFHVFDLSADGLCRRCLPVWVRRSDGLEPW